MCSDTLQDQKGYPTMYYNAIALERHCITLQYNAILECNYAVALQNASTADNFKAQIWQQKRELCITMQCLYFGTR